MIQRTTKTDEVVVRELLDELGRLTPDEIAAKMQEAGVRGRLYCPMACIIANYLPFEVRVWNRTAIAQNGNGWGREFDLPQNVQVFINRFDHGHYPQLETTGCSQ